MDSPFNILQQSPYSLATIPSNSEASEPEAVPRWLPSRYNVRATTTEGSLVLWNVYSNRMGLFKNGLAPKVVELLSRRGVVGKREGLIRYLADRGFLVTDDVDEFRRFRYAFGKDHFSKDRLQIFLLASEDCNFRCKYCYEKFDRGTMEPWVRDGVKRYLEKQASSLKQLRLEWFGGEPLYGIEAIEDIAPFALKLAERHSIQYASKVTTNAYLLTPEVADRLLAWNVRMYQVTLDGPAEHHDRCRPGRDGSPTFEVIFENLKAMHRRKEKFSVTLRINFDRDNAPDLERLLDAMKQEFEDDPRFGIQFRGIARWGGPADDQLNVCAPDEAANVQRRMESEVRKRGLHIAGSIHSAGGLAARVCYAARPNSFIVGATGKIMKCTIELDSNDRNVVGSISESGDLTIDDNKMSLWTEPAFETDANCKRCVFVPSCQGMSCPLLRWETNASPCVGEKTGFKRLLRHAAGDYAN